MTSHRRWLGLLLVTLTTACGAAPAPAPAPRSAGTLLLIGGGLDDDHRDTFERFLALAARHGAPRIAVVTAASGDQDTMADGKVAALQAWWPGVACDVVRRETPTAATVAAIDAATALFFTGGDQQRITARYRPDGGDTPEWLAMRRLLDRGGVIAGSSAGCAMLGPHMLLGGDSTAALGADGPRVGPGMGLQPWLLTDSHFFERHRLGRLVAALEATGQRLGLGVGEDGCVELDLATARLRGIGPSESLLVDVGALQRDGPHRRGVRALRIVPGATIDLAARLRHQAAPTPPRPTSPPEVEPLVEEGQNRQLATWRLCARASQVGCWQLDLPGHRLVAWPGGGGEIALDLEAGSAAPR
jgi:cyanophycinase